MSLILSQSTKQFCFDGRMGPCDYLSTPEQASSHACSRDKGHTGEHFCECGVEWDQLDSADIARWDRQPDDSAYCQCSADWTDGTAYCQNCKRIRL